jgi:release factor glutamine methyltransferase
MPQVDSSQTISDALHTATTLLSRTSTSARLDAELLLEYVTGLPRSSFHSHPERTLPVKAGWSFQQLVKRRLRGEPVAYIRGQQEFWSLLFEVTPQVLIPRPETELVVERALAHLESQGAPRVADLGTGSGAIALAIASERPSACVYATDVDRNTLEVARSNAARLQIGNVRWCVGHWFAALEGEGEQFAVICSNPPYIARNDPDLAPQVRHYEPELALIPGATGLEALEHIIAHAPAHLQGGGWLILEHGWRQAEQVGTLLVRHGFAHVRSHPDLAGQLRVTEAMQP